MIGPGARLRLSVLYPASTGRDFVEVLRALDSLQLADRGLGVVTPAGWRPGGRCLVAHDVNTEEARRRHGQVDVQAVPSGKEYIRYIRQPE